MSRLIDTSDMDEGRVERPNKSQQKREIQALHGLVRKLIALDDAQLRRMQMPGDLEREIVAARGMKHGALKRQLKLITKLMRQRPTESILSTVAELDARKEALDASFHLVERWRDRLLAEGPDALTEFMHDHPSADAGQIRQLVRNAAREAQAGKSPKSARALFRLLRDLLNQDA